jgi:hypothetical protein
MIFYRNVFDLSTIVIWLIDIFNNNYGILFESFNRRSSLGNTLHKNTGQQNKRKLNYKTYIGYIIFFYSFIIYARAGKAA